MLIMILMLMLFFGIVKFALQMAWGLTKFVFGLGLFFVCPLLFVLAVCLGGFSHVWLPIIVIGLLCGRGFSRI